MTDYLSDERTSLKGKRIVITGGTTGIGRTFGVFFAKEGAKVLIFGRHQKELDDALKEINSVGTGFGLTADVSKYEDVQKVFKEADEKMGGVDILINNAGLPAGSIIDSDHNDWEYTIDVMITGYLACAKEALTRMEKDNEGHIVNIGSMSAEARDADSDIYVACKTAIRGFSQSLRKKVAAKGIKVTLVEPGLIGTDLHLRDPRVETNYEAEGKMLKTEDVADAVRYILTLPKRVDIHYIQINPARQDYR